VAATSFVNFLITFPSEINAHLPLHGIGSRLT
jgi:hypothetical protein